ncbi:MAG: M28 family peptidase [bacterium]
MTARPELGSGLRHLAQLARRPRPAGSDAERDARHYAAGVLTSVGFTVREEPFSYSAFPGRYATPIGGAALGATIVLAGVRALVAGGALAPAVILAVGAGTTIAFARVMLTWGVRTTPLLRAEGTNLVATRPGVEPRVWLVAHLDSKSQPVPSALRVVGVATLAAALMLAVVAVALTLLGVGARTTWYVALAAGVVGALPVMASVVGAQSDGAVDNASGVAAVLAAAERLHRTAACGVLLTSAEELGLAGASAWARARAPGVALNCDGVDDDGAFVIMHDRPAPAEVIAAVRAAAPIGTPVRARRMPLGLLTDSSALASNGWRAVTVSHGSLATLRRIHRPADNLLALRGTSIDAVADLLARAAEALAT